MVRAEGDSAGGSGGGAAPSAPTQQQQQGGAAIRPAAGASVKPAGASATIRPAGAGAPRGPPPRGMMPPRPRGPPGVIMGPDGQPLEVVPVEKASDEAWAGVAAVDRGESDERAVDWG